jgi:hypothetical protein
VEDKAYMIVYQDDDNFQFSANVPEILSIIITESLLHYFKIDTILLCIWGIAVLYVKFESFIAEIW